jgi:hypothetical protein
MKVRAFFIARGALMGHFYTTQSNKVQSSSWSLTKQTEVFSNGCPVTVPRWMVLAASYWTRKNFSLRATDKLSCVAIYCTLLYRITDLEGGVNTPKALTTTIPDTEVQQRLLSSVA